MLVPPPVRIEIDALRRAVGEGESSRIAPHLTLVPPVNVRDEDLDAAVAVLQRAAAAQRGPIRLELGPVTSFAPVNPTLHLAVGGDLDAVHRVRDAVFTAPLERPLTHPFDPHVTLVEESTHIDEAIASLAGYRAECTISAIHLMRESRDEDHNRIWRPIADAPFGRRPGVVGRGGLELELTPTGSLPPAAARWIDQRWDDFDVERYGDLRPKEEPIGIVARRDGQIVGAAQGDVRHWGEAYLANLIVAAEVRNEGVGAHVVAAFASLAAERGATYLTLRTEADGRSRAFYERLGFTVWYRMTEWRNGRDFVQMRKEL
jgi:ribosomal protein S18 acetylase RimI-like enzyme